MGTALRWFQRQLFWSDEPLGPRLVGAVVTGIVLGTTGAALAAVLAIVQSHVDPARIDYLKAAKTVGFFTAIWYGKELLPKALRRPPKWARDSSDDDLGTKGDSV